MSDFTLDLKGALRDLSGEVIGRVDEQGRVWSLGEDLEAGQIDTHNFYYNVDGVEMGWVTQQSSPTLYPGGLLAMVVIAATAIGIVLNFVVSGLFYGPVLLVYLKHLPAERKTKYRSLQKYCWIAMALGFVCWASMTIATGLIVTPFTLDALVTAFSKWAGLDNLVDLIRWVTLINSLLIVLCCGVMATLFVPVFSTLMASWIHIRYCRADPENVRPLTAFIEVFQPGFGHILTGYLEDNRDHCVAGAVYYGLVLVIYFLVAATSTIGVGICFTPLLVVLPVLSPLTLLRREVPGLSKFFRAFGARV